MTTDAGGKHGSLPARFFWPDPNEKAPPDDFEAVVFVCFSDPYQTQRRLRLPQGSFEQLSLDDLKKHFKEATLDPAIR